MGPTEFSTLTIQWIDAFGAVVKELFVQTGVVIAAAFGVVAYARTNGLLQSHKENAAKIDDARAKSDQALATAQSAVVTAGQAAVAVPPPSVEVSGAEPIGKIYNQVIVHPADAQVISDSLASALPPAGTGGA